MQVRIQVKLLLLCFLWGCGEQIVVEQPDSKPTSRILVDNFRQQKYSQTINFGVTQQTTEEKTRYAYKPYIDFLAEQAKVNIKLVVVDEYSQLETDLADGVIHLADFPPLAFVQAYDRLKGKLKYLGTYKYTSGGEVARHYYRGYIFVRADAEATRLKDLKGFKMAFVEKTSSSGYNYPMATVLKAGINPDKFFAKIFFAGSHEAVIQAVVRKSADAGATFDIGVKNYLKSKPESLRVIARTAPIPNAAFCASHKLNTRLRVSLLRAAQKLNPDARTSDGRLVFDRERGFTSVGLVRKSPGYYGFVRETVGLLRRYEQQRAQ